MTAIGAPEAWEALVSEVPRAPFIPDVIWVTDDPDDGYRSVSKRDDPDRWHAEVAANTPVITQVNLGEVPPGQTGDWPSSSCSQPSIVVDMLHALDPQAGQSVLEIGTGTGWNAAVLSRRAGDRGRVVTVEVDPVWPSRPGARWPPPETGRWSSPVTAWRDTRPAPRTTG